MDLLRLVAFDPEDLSVISAHLQDALLQVGDIAYLPKERRFAIQVRRYDWEAATPQRRLTCMHFEHVTAVRARGIDQRSEEHTSELQSRQYLVSRLLLEKKKTRPGLDQVGDRKSTRLNSSHATLP